MGHSRGPPLGCVRLLSVRSRCVPLFFSFVVCAHPFLRILALEQLRCNVLQLRSVLHPRFCSIVRAFASLSRGATLPALERFRGACSAPGRCPWVCQILIQ